MKDVVIVSACRTAIGTFGGTWLYGMPLRAASWHPSMGRMYSVTLLARPLRSWSPQLGNLLRICEQAGQRTRALYRREHAGLLAWAGD